MTDRQTTDLPLDDIQGIVLDDYFEQRYSYFLPLRIKRAAKARKWLAESVDKLTSAEVARSEPGRDGGFFNVAFSHEGLKKLGILRELGNAFPSAFVEDSDTPGRARILGDLGANHRDNWLWGSRDNPVHLILLVYFKTRPDKDFAEEFRTSAADRGLELVEPLRRGGDSSNSRPPVTPLQVQLMADNKEHFGFRDLISQPLLEGLEHGNPENTIPPGEILLGYKNALINRDDTETGVEPNTSYVPRAPDGSEFGRNGSYLVFRQLEQDVVGFWEYCTAHAAGSDSAEVPYPPVTLASKMVGRWPSGHPLASSWDPELGADNTDPGTPDDAPALDDPDFRHKLLEFHQALDDFDYERDDPRGERCPFGSHIRRSNPRNWELGTFPEESQFLSNQHRIMRRGRTYGPSLIDATVMDTNTFPETVRDVLRIRDKVSRDEALDDNERTLLERSEQRRGLHFLCFNSDLERQFEFVQQQWCNNPKFAGLNSDSDPLIGPCHDPETTGIDTATFTMPANPLRHRCTGMRPFVTVKGSGYFFMPSISDVKKLGEGRWLKQLELAIAVTDPDDYHVPYDVLVGDDDEAPQADKALDDAS